MKKLWILLMALALNVWAADVEDEEEYEEEEETEEVAPAPKPKKVKKAKPAMTGPQFGLGATFFSFGELATGAPGLQVTYLLNPDWRLGLGLQYVSKTTSPEVGDAVTSTTMILIPKVAMNLNGLALPAYAGAQLRYFDNKVGEAKTSHNTLSVLMGAEAELVKNVKIGVESYVNYYMQSIENVSDISEISLSSAIWLTWYAF